MWDEKAHAEKSKVPSRHLSIQSPTQVERLLSLRNHPQSECGPFSDKLRIFRRDVIRQFRYKADVFLHVKPQLHWDGIVNTEPRVVNLLHVLRHRVRPVQEVGGDVVELRKPQPREHTTAVELQVVVLGGVEGHARADVKHETAIVGAVPPASVRVVVDERPLEPLRGDTPVLLQAAHEKPQQRSTALGRGEARQRELAHGRVDKRHAGDASAPAGDERRVEAPACSRRLNGAGTRCWSLGGAQAGAESLGEKVPVVSPHEHHDERLALPVLRPALLMAILEDQLVDSSRGNAPV